MNIDNHLKQIISKPSTAIFYTPSYYENSLTYLFTENPEIILTADKNNFNEVLSEVDKWIKKDYSGFGFINYEAGYLFENKLNNLLTADAKQLLKFFFYKNENIKITDSSSLELILKQNEKDFSISDFEFNTSENDFYEAVKKIHQYIAEGDTYQVNYTIKGKFDFEGDLLSFYKRLIFNQSAKYSAFINTGDSYILSLSPELFFSSEKNYLKTRPMKGTLQRGYNKADDSLAEYTLKNGEKNRAENLMILDLLRNDMGRISEFGTVRLRKLFSVEKYETLLQMTSEIESKLREDISFSGIIKNIFPCGSVTGAPKISTMKIINELENEERGIYTGAIGLIHNDKKIFNVAIRTIELKKTDSKKFNAEIGIGSGIVWDSNPEKEYEEVLLKSNFLVKPFPYFELIETMKYSGGEIEREDLHLKRLEESASYFLFKFDKEIIIASIKNEVSKLDSLKEYKVRLLLNKWGKVKIEVSQMPISPEEIKIIISEKIISTEDRFQYFKTTNRDLYDAEYKKYSGKGFFDVVFINEKNQVAEGSITNIFINKMGLLYTPPVSCGILPGVFRKHWLQTNINIKEENFYKDDLLIADEIILTNSLRGQIKVAKLYLNEIEFIDFKGVQSRNI
jgi:para-aminobenzoate synthetase/4-amino-4-deoxychorismate lyase